MSIFWQLRFQISHWWHYFSKLPLYLTIANLSQNCKFFCNYDFIFHELWIQTLKIALFLTSNLILQLSVYVLLRNGLPLLTANVNQQILNSLNHIPSLQNPTLQRHVCQSDVSETKCMKWLIGRDPFWLADFLIAVVIYQDVYVNKICQSLRTFYVWSHKSSQHH